MALLRACICFKTVHQRFRQYLHVAQRQVTERLILQVRIDHRQRDERSQASQSKSYIPNSYSSVKM